MIDSVIGALTTITAFLAMLGVLVVVHELGHFLTAIRLGVAVEEFGIGYPPRAFTLFERKGVRYTINWLPLGGFVRFAGDGDTVSGVGGLTQAAPWKRIIILVAGPAMNLVLAVAIFSGMFLINGIPIVQDGATITAVYPDTPAARAEFRAGDLLTQLDGTAVARDFSGFGAIARENLGQAIVAVVQRDGQLVTLTVTPGPWSDGATTIEAGFGFSYEPNLTLTPANPLDATIAGVRHTITVFTYFIGALGQLFGSLIGVAEPPPGGVTGVVGIARGTGEIIERDGWSGFLQWTALISLNLFLVNLLPIPALDGSHIVFALLEMARRGRKLPAEREAMVHAFGFMVLMGLMVLITISDVAQWLSGAPVLGG